MANLPSKHVSILIIDKTLFVLSRCQDMFKPFPLPTLFQFLNHDQDVPLSVDETETENAVKNCKPGFFSPILRQQAQQSF